MSTVVMDRASESRMFSEAIDTFKTLLPAKDVEKAHDIWDEFASDYYGQIELLNAAKEGDVTAVNYLYLKLIPQISSVFWKNFLGPNANFRRQRLENGDQFAFASMVYEVLLSSSAGEGVTDVSSPLDSFDPEVFDENTNLIDKFGFYLKGFLKNEAMKWNRKEMRGGITGKKEKGAEEDVSSVSFEDAENHESGRNDFNETEDLDAWDAFKVDEDLDLGKKPTPRDVLKDFLSQEDKFNVSSVAEKYGTTNSTIRNRLAGMADVLEKHGIDKDSFARLLQIHGGKTLASQL